MPTAGNNTYRRLLRQGERLLRRRARPAPCEDAAFDAFLLLEKATGISRTAYPLKKNDSPTAEERAEYLSLLRRRAEGEPVQYLLGEWEFMGLPLYVGPGVLIPRPETELLVEQSLELLRGRPNPRILELCGGSGCISIALAKARPDAEITCLELSAQALCYLRRNIARHGVPNLTAVEGDALSPPPEIAGCYDAILSNPPYIAAGQLPALQREVRQEPAMALDGGPDGLRFYRGFHRLYPPMLSPGGFLLYEIGEEQGGAVSALLRTAGLQEVRVLRDFSGLDRAVLGFSPPNK